MGLATLELSEPEGRNLDLSSMPAIVYQGFSIHGNEPSGSNAGLMVAYHLAASQDSSVTELLDDVIILFDPSFNPDGLQRFSQWANTHKSNILNPDPNDREYNEAWPRGRTNHYWFDMNRDWLPVQLPESKARIKSFTEWSFGNRVFSRGESHFIATPNQFKQRRLVFDSVLSGHRIVSHLIRYASLIRFDTYSRTNLLIFGGASVGV